VIPHAEATISRWLADALARLGVDALEAPERLLWFLGVGGVCALLALRSRPIAVAWPGMAEALRAGGRTFELVPTLAIALRALALGCLALVLARPVAVHEAPPEPGHGLDILLALDTSASMRALDTSADPAARPTDGAPHSQYTRTRLDLAVRVVSRFATQRVAEGDRVGLVVFGSTAFTQCPLTTDGELLSAALDRVAVGIAGEATALGDALALAVKRAPPSDTSLGRVIVLLTDGRSTAGSVPIEIAIELARGENLRVHTVSIGTGGAEVPIAPRPGRGLAPLRFERHDTDPATLARIARATGGRFYEATRPSDLEAVYREIDALERTERPLPPRFRTTLSAEPLLATAGVFLLLEILLAGVLRRRVP
jgi:Ca-activated chloride channel family protein